MMKKKKIDNVIPLEERKKKKISKKRRIRNKGSVDFALLLTTLALVFIGIIMVFSSSWPKALKEFDDQYYFVRRQIIFSILGFIIMVVFMNIDYNIWKEYCGIIFLGSLSTVLILLFTPLGQDFLGAKRWIKIGPLTFMPGDIIKVGSIIFFANFLSNKEDDISTFKQGTLPGLMIVFLSVASILVQQDLGTTITLGSTLIIMFIIGGMNLYHLTPLVLSGVGAVFALLKKIESTPELKKNFRIKRILSFRNPFEDAKGIGFQAVQSLYALGSGGVFGLGLGKSKQKFFYIPEAYTDFIFAIIAEELGIVGAGGVIILYMILMLRGVFIAMKAENSFGMYLAIGITALIALQSIIHMGVVTSSIPTTGITLPFISYGGTSLIINMASIGILLNISKSNRSGSN